MLKLCFWIGVSIGKVLSMPGRGNTNAEVDVVFTVAMVRPFSDVSMWKADKFSGPVNDYPGRGCRKPGETNFRYQKRYLFLA